MKFTFVIIAILIAGYIASCYLVEHQEKHKKFFKKKVLEMCDFMPPWGNYAAADEDGCIFIFNSKPEYKDGRWRSDNACFYIGNCMQCASFSSDSLVGLK